jgi:ABC-type methionine transport system permease subunit
VLHDTNITVATKTGATVSSSLASTMVIFTDHLYLYLAITGAVVSTLGALHEVLGHTADYTTQKAVSAIIKAFVLGILSIPFWFLCITNGVLEHISGISIGNVSSSLALIISFALSWYTVPIFEWLVNKVKRNAK